MTDPMGNLFPCSEIGLVDAYIEDGVNKYQIGTLQEGVTGDRKVFPKYEKISQEDSPCRKCRLFPTCCGACPKQWQDYNIPCPTGKFNLKEKMMLAYLLLQKRKNAESSHLFFM